MNKNNKVLVRDFLSDVFGKNSIFGDDLFGNLWEQVTISDNIQTFPPYNIVKVDENKANVSVALAGFTKNDVKITLDNNTLTISGEKQKSESESAVYLHKGIADRSFLLKLSVADYAEVTSADLKDGILNISIVRNIPEEKLPKQIEIK